MTVVVRVSLARATLLAVALPASACDSRDARRDGAATDADGDADDEGDGERDAAEETGPPADPGPLTLVVYERGVTEERLCDVDGNGSLDNVIADLGSPAAELAAAAVSSAFQTTIRLTGVRTLVHFPWVADTAVPEDPDTAIAAFGGSDTDVPEDREDDFSGDEAFYGQAGDLDGCGEPRIAAFGARIRRGQLDVDLGPLTIEGVTLLGAVPCLGTIEPGGVSAELYLCAYATAANLGATRVSSTTWLEAFVGGGAVFGLPSLPGMTPDIDLDGDGLERFTVDGNGRVTGCVDGDGYTEIDGPDCWQDPRIADGFSLTVVLLAVRARFAGREPGWEGLVDGGCDEPPEQSFWDDR